MVKKLIIKKFTLLLILSVFCFSSGTLGGFLLYEHDVHFDHNNAHTHHHNEDHALGETDHKDADIILFLDYWVSNSSGFNKTHFTVNTFAHFTLSSEYFHKFFNFSLKTIQSLNISKPLPADLYQLHSSYLI